MLGSVLLPSALQSHSTKPSSGTRRNTITSGIGAPALPPRRNSLSTAPAAQSAQLKSITLSGGMESRYHRSSSPRRAYNPARASTGTFADPSYDYSSYRPSSPRSSADRLSSTSQHHSSSSHASYAPSGSSSSRANALKYDSTYGQQTRPRRNTEDRMHRPNVASLTSLPLRTPYTQDHRPSSPLTSSPRAHAHGDTYITHGSRQDSGSTSSHKKIYSVDSSHTAKLVAETQVESPRHRDSGYGGVTSGRSSYHPGGSGSANSSSKPTTRHADLGDNGYSYTDAAGMYRDTEPAWRRPRAGSVERGSRPSSMLVERPPRTSTREPGPPPSTRGFDKINGGYPRPARSNSIERRERHQDPYASDSAPHRSSSNRHAPAAVHQELHREPRRAETYDEYGRSREPEPKRHNTYDRYEDRDVASRGFGIAPASSGPAQDQYALDRQPVHPPYESHRAPPVEHTPSAYHSDRGAEPRRSERPVSSYDSYDPPRSDRSRSEYKQDSGRDGRAIPVAAGALAGMSAVAGIAAAHGKAKEKEREERGSSEERERQKRREYDDRDRRDDRYDDRGRRDDKRSSRLPDERREPERRDALPAPPPPSQPPLAPPVAAPAYAYASASEPERPVSRDRPYPNEENPPPKPPRKTSPEGSDAERPRHYVDRDSERSRKEPAPASAAIDPDEDYRRRLAQAEKEAEQSRRAAADRHDSDSDGTRDRRRRRDRSRSRSRGRDERRERSSPSQPQALTRFENPDSADRQDSVDKLNPDAPGKSVQIVVPRKDQSPPLRGILRKPTAKFPEDPEPIREGVAPHKDSLKGKEIPVGARWTRIDRKLVNPEALERAKERFEERMDCVIVLRVLAKDEIQKLADKTKQIREERGMSDFILSRHVRLG
jgi:hypothetical protein